MQKQNIGNAGEYYIASRLSAENFIAPITLGRAEKYDILALNPQGRTIKLSVKTQFLETSKGFPLSERDEIGASENFYYVFIRLNEFKKEPDFWIIPSTIVSPILKSSHKKWLSILGRINQQHNDSSLRKLPIILSRSEIGFYPKNWENKLIQYYKHLKQLQ